jgi:hypothetical protein
LTRGVCVLLALLAAAAAASLIPRSDVALFDELALLRTPLDAAHTLSRQVDAAHTHGRAYVHVSLRNKNIYLRAFPPLIDVWELARYDIALDFLAALLNHNATLPPAIDFAFTASDHFVASEVAHKSDACARLDAAVCEPCIAANCCAVFVCSRVRARAERADRFQFLFPGYEFDRHTWFHAPANVSAATAAFDARHRWRRKQPAAVWRGSPNGLFFKDGEWNRSVDGNPRARLVDFASRHADLIDARFVQMPEQERPWAEQFRAFDLVPPMPQESFAAFRAIIDVDGGGWSARLVRLMTYNSVLLRQQTDHDTLYMDQLRPLNDSDWLDEDLASPSDDELVERWLSPRGRAPCGVVWFRYDMADLVPLVSRINAMSPLLLMRIVTAARTFVERHLTLTSLFDVMAASLQRYASLQPSVRAIAQSEAPYMPCHSAECEADCRRPRPATNAVCRWDGQRCTLSLAQTNVSRWRRSQCLLICTARAQERHNQVRKKALRAQAWRKSVPATVEH